MSEAAAVHSLTLSTGGKIPVIGLGVFKTEAQKTTSIVYKALKVGYRHIDSAALYKNEKQVSEGIAKWISEDPEHNKREDVFYTTKIWNDDHGYDLTKKAIERALENAKAIGYIDLLLIHSPKSNYEKRHGTWLAMQEAYKSGSVKSIGVSNYGIKHLEELLKYPDLEVKPSVNQFEVHPWLSRKELIDYCKSKDIIVEAYSPLVRGQKRDDPTVAEIAKKYGKQPAQVLIKWSLEKGLVCLPKTETESRLLPNLSVGDFELSKEDLAILDSLNVNYTSGWDPTTYPLDNESPE